MSMRKREVTDEMVERAFIWLNHNAGFGGEPFSESYRQVRAALDAALNHPPAEDIPVSYGMARDGGRAWNASIGYPGTESAPRDNEIFTAIYRAMELVRREEAAQDVTTDGVPFTRTHHLHRRKTDYSDGGVLHRRSTDPR